MNATAKDIIGEVGDIFDDSKKVREWLQEHGYGGLFKLLEDAEIYGCECGLSGLMACGEGYMDCRAGYANELPCLCDEHTCLGSSVNDTICAGKGIKLSTLENIMAIDTPI